MLSLGSNFWGAANMPKAAGRHVSSDGFFANIFPMFMQAFASLFVHATPHIFFGTNQVEIQTLRIATTFPAFATVAQCLAQSTIIRARLASKSPR